MLKIILRIKKKLDASVCMSLSQTLIYKFSILFVFICVPNLTQYNSEHKKICSANNEIFYKEAY